MEPWMLRERKYGLGWKEEPKATPWPGKGFHWPVDCAEVWGHPWMRTFQCPRCKQGYEFRKDDMTAALLFCYGNGIREMEDEA
jgi:hypothetical protein